MTAISIPICCLFHWSTVRKCPYMHHCETMSVHYDNDCICFTTARVLVTHIRYAHAESYVANTCSLRLVEAQYTAQLPLHMFLTAAAVIETHSIASFNKRLVAQHQIYLWGYKFQDGWTYNRELRDFLTIFEQSGSNTASFEQHTYPSWTQILNPP